MLATMLSLLAVQTPPIRLEAEDGVLKGGATLSTARPGFSGKGYVNALTKSGDSVEWRFPAKAGIYIARVRYCSPGQNKGFGLIANGVGSSSMFPPSKDEFVWHEAGRLELKDGENTLVLDRGWGYYDLDAIEFVPAPPPAPLKPIANKLANPNATPEARKLFRKLLDNYGKITFSGQYGEEDNALAKQISGRMPAIFGGDFMDYSPSRLDRGANPNGESERMIEAARRGQMVTISWHWNAPKDLLDRMIKDAQGRDVDARWYKGFYSNATTFNVAKAMADPNSEDYKLLIRDIDRIAVELRKFANADVPVLWRPLHEAEGRWFWWGARGPEPCIKLWRLMYDRLTNKHRLNNLIWVWNSIEPEWYPGDDTVDIVGADLYPSDGKDSLASTWDPMLKWLDGRKMIALTEIGGVPDVERMWRFGVRWSYFVSWTGDLGPKKTPAEDVARIYRSERVGALR